MAGFKMVKPEKLTSRKTKRDSSPEWKCGQVKILLVPFLRQNVMALQQNKK